MKNLVLSLMSACFLLAGTAAKADSLTVSLVSPYQNIAGAGVVIFNATVTNHTNQIVYLNGDSPSIDSPLTLNDSPYNNNFPLTLGAGDSFTGELFDVDIPVGTSLGLYAGNFAITGGFNSSDTAVVGSANFNVNVTPEPPNFVLLATGLACSLVYVKAHRRRLMV